MRLAGRRNLHIEVPKASYVKLKIASFERELTVQDVFGGFCALLATQDERAFQILDELALMKRSGQLTKAIESESLSDVQRDLLYDMMEKGQE